MPNPMRKSAATFVPGSTPTLAITLKSLRNPPFSLSLSSQPSSTSIQELKNAVAQHVGAKSIEPIKILYKKKPCSDSRTIKEVIGNDDPVGEIEFSVMIVGGMATTAAAQDEGKASVEENKPPVAHTRSGEDVIESEDFWKDLHGFLMQRIRDEGKATELWEVFKEGWRKRRG